MPQPKGKTGNPNGRPIGTLNKVTAHYRAIVSDLLTDMLPQVKEDIKNIPDPIIRIQVFERLLSYTLPKPQPMSFPLDDGLEMRNKGNKTVVVIKESLPDNMTDEQLEQYINELNLDDL